MFSRQCLEFEHFQVTFLFWVLQLQRWFVENLDKIYKDESLIWLRMPRNAPTNPTIPSSVQKGILHFSTHITLSTCKTENWTLCSIWWQNDFDLLHVLRLACNTEVFEHVGQELEGGSLEWILLPALQHDLKLSPS